MKIKTYLLTLILLCSNSWAKREAIIAKNLDISSSKSGDKVTGEISANFLDVDYEEHNFKAYDDDMAMSGTFEIEKQNLKTKVSFIEFSTKLEEDNPLAQLDRLELVDTELKFNRESMLFNSPSLLLQSRGDSVTALNLRGECDPLGDSTTDVDIVCLKNGKLNSSDVHIQNPSINLRMKNLNTTITPSDISLKTNQAEFRSNGEVTIVKDFKLRCKNLIKRRFKEDEVVAGCLKSSNIDLDRFDERKVKSIEKGIVDLEDIRNLRIEIRDSSLVLKSKIKILFKISLRVYGKIHYIPEQKLIRLDITKARFAGIPAKKLTMMIMKLFIEEDSIRIDDDTIFIKV